MSHVLNLASTLGIMCTRLSVDARYYSETGPSEAEIWTGVWCKDGRVLVDDGIDFTQLPSSNFEKTITAYMKNRQGTFMKEAHHFESIPSISIYRQDVKNKEQPAPEKLPPTRQCPYCSENSLS